MSLSSSTTASVVTPPRAEGVEYDGNKKCADLAPAGTTWEEFTIDAIPENGTYDDPKSNLVITIANASPQMFDWASNDLDMAAVLVKGSNGGIQYLYPGPSDFSDTGLHALEAKKNYHDISHVSFCYRVGGDTQPTVDQPVNPQPANPPPANPQAANPQPANAAGDPAASEQAACGTAGCGSGVRRADSDRAARHRSTR
ncbi:MAG TPA: hypothetical protein VEG38_18645 [Acidimicrobiia bacterium]|nr:hypothetical protein [Acidimicrobiia bacterium]